MGNKVNKLKFNVNNKNNKSKKNANHTINSSINSDMKLLCLVYGFCKETNLCHSHFVPSSIMDLCLKYYISKTILIWFNPFITSSYDNNIKNSHTNNYEISMIKFDDAFSSKFYDQQTMTKCIISQNNHKMNRITTTTTKHVNKSSKSFKNLVYHDYGCCCKQSSNIIPPYLSRLLSKSNIKSMTNNETNYHIIYQCGGTVYNKKHSDISDNNHNNNNNNNNIHSIKASKLCGVFIIDPNSSNLYNYKLPSLPISIAGNNLIYDKEYGLISLGGYTKLKPYKPISNIDALVPSFSYQQYIHQKSVFNLPIHGEIKYIPSCTNKKRKKLVLDWNNLQNLPQKLSFTSGTIFTDYDHNKKLIICGGLTNINDTKSNKCYIYNFNKNIWSKSIASMKCYRSNAGIFHSETRNNIYIGGGEGNITRQSVEHYNFYKNEWYSFPKRTNLYYHKPILWTDSVTNNILYIASCVGNMEMIDLRVGCKWNIICNNKKRNNSLSNIFDVQYTLNKPYFSDNDLNTFPALLLK